MRRLLFATLLLTALSVAHGVDHAVGHPADAVGRIPGILGFAILAGLFYLILRKDQRAPLAAAIAGFGTTAGLLAIHIAPEWGVFSDPYSKLDLGFISWAIVFANALAALWLGALGLRELRAKPAITATV